MSAKYFLINNNPPHSGVGRYAYSLFKALYTVLKGEVQFVSWDRQLFDRSYNTLSYFHLNWLYYVLKLRLLSRRLSLKDVSLVHVANAGYLASIIPSIKKRNRRVVLTVHDVIPENLRDSFSHRMAGKAITNASLADYIVCVSENVRKNLPTVLGANLERITTVHYGVDHSLFKPRDKTWARRKLNLPTNMPIILNVGSEEPRKNIPILIKAFYEIIKDIPNAILVRVGPRTARVSKIITALGLDGRIYYRRASDREVALYYNAEDLLVHPAYHEDFGMTILEAMASGCPVIASNRTAIPEVIGNAGILLDPYDFGYLAYWMCEVLTNEDLRAKLSEAGYKRSLSFSWEKCAKETLEVYREVLNEF